MAIPDLPPGTRVRLRAPNRLLKLRSSLGTIVKREPTGWYIVKLDQPARYRGLNLWYVRDAADNVEILEGGSRSRSESR